MPPRTQHIGRKRVRGRFTKDSPPRSPSLVQQAAAGMEPSQTSDTPSIQKASMSSSTKRSRSTKENENPKQHNLRNKKRNTGSVTSTTESASAIHDEESLTKKMEPKKVKKEEEATTSTEQHNNPRLTASNPFGGVSSGGDVHATYHQQARDSTPLMSGALPIHHVRTGSQQGDMFAGLPQHPQTPFGFTNPSPYGIGPTSQYRDSFRSASQMPRSPHGAMSTTSSGMGPWSSQQLGLSLGGQSMNQPPNYHSTMSPGGQGMNVALPTNPYVTMPTPNNAIVAPIRRPSFAQGPAAQVSPDPLASSSGVIIPKTQGIPANPSRPMMQRMGKIRALEAILAEMKFKKATLAKKMDMSRPARAGARVGLSDPQASADGLTVAFGNNLHHAYLESNARGEQHSGSSQHIETPSTQSIRNATLPPQQTPGTPTPSQQPSLRAQPTTPVRLATHVPSGQTTIPFSHTQHGTPGSQTAQTPTPTFATEIDRLLYQAVSHVDNTMKWPAVAQVLKTLTGREYDPLQCRARARQINHNLVKRRLQMDQQMQMAARLGSGATGNGNSTIFRNTAALPANPFGNEATGSPSVSTATPAIPTAGPRSQPTAAYQALVEKVVESQLASPSAGEVTDTEARDFHESSTEGATLQNGKAKAGNGEELDPSENEPYPLAELIDFEGGGANEDKQQDEVGGEVSDADADKEGATEVDE